MTDIKMNCEIFIVVLYCNRSVISNHITMHQWKILAKYMKEHIFDFNIFRWLLKNYIPFRLTKKIIKISKYLLNKWKLIQMSSDRISSDSQFH